VYGDKEYHRQKSKEYWDSAQAFKYLDDKIAGEPFLWESAKED